MLYSNLILSGRLHSYLTDIDTRARNKLHLLVTQLAEKEDINEQLEGVGFVNLGVKARPDLVVLKQIGRASCRERV